MNELVNMKLENKKEYPVYYKELEDLNLYLKDFKEVDVEDIDEIQTIQESYIEQTYCNKESAVSLFIHPLDCKKIIFPIDAFIYIKNEYMINPGTDICNFFDSHHYFGYSYNLRVDCGSKYLVFLIDVEKNFYPPLPMSKFPNIYKVLPITEENRVEIYDEFEKRGYHYKDSQKASEENLEKFKISLEEKITLADESAQKEISDILTLKTAPGITANSIEFIKSDGSSHKLYSRIEEKNLDETSSSIKI